MNEIKRSSPLRRWWPFAALCALAAVRWSVLDGVPAAAPSPASFALGCASACLVALTLASVRRLPLPSAPAFAGAGAAGALMLCGPALGVLVGSRAVESSALTMALALVPVVVAVARPAFHRGESSEVAGRMWPGIAAVAALLLLLPEPSLDGAYRVALLVAAPVMTGVGAVWLRTRTAAFLWRAVPALALSAALAASLAFARHTSWTRATWLAAAFDGALSGLSILALVRVGGTRWSAQFVLVPLLVVLESLALLRPHLEARALAGIGLLAASTVFLLLPPRAPDAFEVAPSD